MGARVRDARRRRKAEGERRAPPGERRELERGAAPRGWDAGRQEGARPSHLASPAAAPARPGRDLRGAPGGGAAPPLPYLARPGFRELNRASAVGTRLSGGAGQLSPPPAPAAPSPSCSPSGTETPGGSAWAAPNGPSGIPRSTPPPLEALGPAWLGILGQGTGL